MDSVDFEYRSMLQNRLRCAESFLENSRSFAERLDCLLECAGAGYGVDLMEMRACLVVDFQELAAEVLRLQRQLILVRRKQTGSRSY